MIACHAESLSPLEWPDRHAVRALLRHTNQAIDEVGNAVGEEQGVHGMRGAIGVPQGERAVVVRSGRQAVNLAVHAAVLAIDIIEESRRAEKVVEGGIEDRFVTRGHGFDFDSGKVRVPRCMRGATDFFEIPAGDFCGDVLACSLFAHSGDSCLYRDHFFVLGLEMQQAFQRRTFRVAHRRTEGIVVGNNFG